jgi:hypothetical protein
VKVTVWELPEFFTVAVDGLAVPFGPTLGVIVKV